MVNRLWYTHPAVTVLIQATPAVCLRTLSEAARPSTERLHLRNLFTNGRRYLLYPLKDGFQMHMTSKHLWQRRRTRIAAVVFGSFSEVGSGITRLHLRARITTLYLIDVFILPLWMSALLIFGPISKTVAVLSIAALFTLSWLWHRYNATLQAVEMVYFIQTALDDLAPAEIPALNDTTQNVVYSDFQSQWQKFYEQHKGERPLTQNADLDS